MSTDYKLEEADFNIIYSASLLIPRRVFVDAYISNVS